MSMNKGTKEIGFTLANCIKLQTEARQMVTVIITFISKCVMDRLGLTTFGDTRTGFYKVVDDVLDDSTNLYQSGQ